MPGPDPFGLSYDETPDGRPLVRAEIWGDSRGPFPGNPRHRMARARAVLLNLHRGGWLCLCCGEPVPIWRRADAVYCCEGCRKRSKRARQPAGRLSAPLLTSAPCVQGNGELP